MSQPNININVHAKPVSHLNPFPVTVISAVTQPSFDTAIAAIAAKLDTITQNISQTTQQ